MEVLIHIGINTVELNGKYFTYLVKENDKVKKGDTLVTFDLDAIKAEGYSLATPMVVTNSDDYKEIEALVAGPIEAGTDVLRVC